MGKLKNELFFFVARCTRILERKENENFALETVIKAVKKELARFDEVAWKNSGFDEILLKLLKDFEKCEGDYPTILSMFLVVSMRFDVASYYSFMYLLEVAFALTTEDILAYNYDKYLDMYLDEVVYNKIMRLSSDDIASAVCDIIADTPYEFVVHHHYHGEIDSVLKKYTKKNSILGHAGSLEDILIVLGEYAKSNDEKFILGLLNETITTLSNQQRTKIYNDILRLEKIYGKKEEIVIPVIFDYIKGHLKMIRGLGVIDGGKSRQHEEFYVQIEKALKMVSYKSEEDPWFGMLFRKVRQLLHDYDEISIPSGTKREILYHCDILQDTETNCVYKLIFFVLLAEYSPRNRHVPFPIISDIAHVVVTRRVAIGDFGKYLTLFMTYRLRLELEEFPTLKRLCYIIEVVEEGHKAKTEDELLQMAYKILAHYSSKPYGPLFEGNYDIASMYRALNSIMNDEYLREFFDENDRRNLTLLLDFEDEEFARFFKNLVERISKIEARYDTRKVTAIKMILKCVSDYWSFARSGLVLLERNSDKKI